MRNVPIEGSDTTEIAPVNGVMHVAGIIQSPHNKVCISWEVDGSSGATHCEAWRGQYEIDCLVSAGYSIKGVSLAS